MEILKRKGLYTVKVQMLQYVNYICIKKGDIKALSKADIFQVFTNEVSFFFSFLKFIFLIGV